MLELIVLSISILANTTLATIVIIKGSRRSINRMFALFLVTIVFWLVVNYLSMYPPFGGQLLWARVTMAAAALMSTALVLTVNLYPTGSRYFHWLPRVAFLFGSLTALVALSPWLFTELSLSPTGIRPVAGPGMVLFAPFAFGTLILSIVILARRHRKLRGALRQQVSLALLGIVLTFSLLLLLNLVGVSIFGTTAPLAWSPLVVLIFTVSFAYGIVRFRLFDVRLVVARFVAYLLLVLVTGSLYGIAIAGLSLSLSGVRPTVMQIVLSMIVVGILMLFVQPLRRALNRITDTLFHQNAYDPKVVFDKITTLLVRATDTKSAAQGVIAVLQEALRSEYAALIILEGPENERYVSVGQRVPSLPKVRHLQLDKAPDIAVLDTDAVDGEWHQKMQAINAAVIVRLQTNGQVLGYCVVGEKLSGSPYISHDIDLIRIAADELAVAIQNTVRFEQIQEFNATLQHRVNGATKELRSSNRQLQKLDEAKDEFVSMASHQLRTPLTSVKGYIDMVLQGDAGKITPMQHQLLSEAFTSSERMVHLINDFLNVSRLQTGKFMLDQRPIDLAKVIGQEVESLRTTASARGLELRYRKPARIPILYLDEGKLRQVAMNFIDNAIYYSREDSVITVKLRVDQGDVLLEVHDTGIGVPAEEQAHLFTKFFRAANARRQRPDGTGVGLYLAKKVITEHGGSIVFSSKEGEGSIFGFRLPVQLLSSAPAGETDNFKN